MLDFLSFVNQRYKENINTRNAVFSCFILVFMNILMILNNSEAFSMIILIPVMGIFIIGWIDIVTSKICE